MARPMKPLVRGGGFYPSRKWTPLVYAGGYTTANGGEEPAPPPIEKTIIGNPIHILDALAKPAQALSVALEPVQDLHGYNNPWPAGGSANKCSSGFEIGNINWSNGNNVNSTSRIRTVDYIEVAAGETYYFYVKSNGNNIPINLHFYDANKAWLGSPAYLGSDKRTKTMPQDCKYIKFAVYPDYGTTYKNDIAVNYPATVTTFSPYSNLCPISGWTGANIHVSPTTDAADGETYSITFPTSAGTVYGGTLDVTTGKLTVDRAIVDLGTLKWNKNSGERQFYARIASKANGEFNVLSSQYPTATEPGVSNMPDPSIKGNQANAYVNVVDSRYGNDVTAFTAAMSGVQLVYELATPTTIQLTPTQVELLQGENNLFSDGEMTLVYLADGNASEIEALNILLGGRYVNNHEADEPTDREALDIVLGGKK